MEIKVESPYSVGDKIYLVKRFYEDEEDEKGTHFVAEAEIESVDACMGIKGAEVTGLRAVWKDPNGKDGDEWFGVGEFDRFYKTKELAKAKVDEKENEKYKKTSKERHREAMNIKSLLEEFDPVYQEMMKKTR